MRRITEKYPKVRFIYNFVYDVYDGYPIESEFENDKIDTLDNEEDARIKYPNHYIVARPIDTTCVECKTSTKIDSFENIIRNHKENCWYA